MNTEKITKHYNQISGDERYRLILAATGRGDAEEVERLRATRRTKSIQIYDDMPWMLAFREMATLVFINLADLVAERHDVLLTFCSYYEQLQSATPRTRNKKSHNARPKPKEKARLQELWHACFAWGFTLKALIDGWHLFCEQLAVPPYLIWETLPGFERLMRDLQRFQDDVLAFTPQQMVEYLRSQHNDEEPESTLDSLVSPESYADGWTGILREYAQRLNG